MTGPTGAAMTTAYEPFFKNLLHDMHRIGRRRGAADILNALMQLHSQILALGRLPCELFPVGVEDDVQLQRAIGVFADLADGVGQDDRLVHYRRALRAALAPRASSNVSTQARASLGVPSGIPVASVR